ncbi:MAG: S1C family serine protease [Clostridia bacterium]
MKQNVDMEFKQKQLEKHVNVYMIFLALIGLICMIVCSGILFLMHKKENQLTATDIFNDNIYSIVEIKAYTEDVGESFGTAEFIDNKGTLVTNAHVVTYTKFNVRFAFDEFYIRFASDEEYIEISILKYDANLDIAVLQMNPTVHKFKPIEIYDSSKISTGDKIYTIGNSANYGLSMSEGLIGSPLINITYNEQTRSVIQANINITEGNSGGALLDYKGRIIGITTFRTRDNSGNVIYGIAYCIPINTVLQYINA